MPISIFYQKFQERKLEYGHIGKEFLYQLRKLLENHYAGEVGRRIRFVDQSTKNIYEISVIYEDTSDEEYKKSLCHIDINYYILKESDSKKIKVNFTLEIIPKNLQNQLIKVLAMRIY
ncbi:MAG: hypothetical protein QT11_C0001G0259 [archaeon GW2011_AR20]|nr:MAG: hypothetical protein QT11_C0001G0259 [archaeon GW2011_AR20]AQS28429.1 hypothetical protein [uncultured archaeon]MBS3160266.1 hypothetical protein [Candidatus Woesearchaeota archaeon]